jgi:MFS family permease
MNLHEDNESTTAILKQKKIGFIGATCSLAVVYAASSAPIPLYTIYRQAKGFTSVDFSLSTVSYFAGTVIALLMFARLSNHLGRRPVTLAALGLTFIGCLVFAYISNVPMFLIGRLIQGVACGLASSTISAYVMDNAPVTPGGVGAAVTSGAPMIGLAVGAFGSGALKEYGMGSLALIFGIIIVMIVCCALLIAAGPETVTRTGGAIASLVPQIRVPKELRRLLPAASSTFVGTWAIGGFYQAFSSSMAAEQLHTTNTLVAAAVFACLMAPNAIGGSLVGRMKSDMAQRIGMVAFCLSVVAILISLKAGVILPFLAASVFAGVAWGAAFTGSMRGLLDKTSKAERAGVLSTVFLISYSGAALPNLIVGRLANSFSLFEIAEGYGLLVAVACILTLFTSWWGKEKSIFKPES